jgi:hypothetical protein
MGQSNLRSIALNSVRRLRRQSCRSSSSSPQAFSQLRPRFPKAIPPELPCPRALTLAGVDLIEAAAATLAVAGSLTVPLALSPNPSVVKNESG